MSIILEIFNKFRNEVKWRDCGRLLWIQGVRVLNLVVGVLCYRNAEVLNLLLRI
jgi:hypothetical protein